MHVWRPALWALATRAGALVAASCAFALSADPVAVVNSLRASGCGPEPPVRAQLTTTADLDAVARELARGASLSAALARVGYPAQGSTSLHVRGSREDATIARVLAERHCAAINDARYTEFGFAQSRDETWIVLAYRKLLPVVLEAATVAERVLELVNRARSEPRTCGRERLPAAGSVRLSVLLTSAALLHAQDMARRGELSHTGGDGGDSGARITRAGYDWRAAGENIAAGQPDPDAVVAAWLESPGHCTTLMGAPFTEMGIGYAIAPGKNPGIYWAQVFATPL